MLSVVILTKNEAHQISKCLSSVSWADEVIIVDDYSSDKTRETAKKALPKVKIYSRLLNGDFASQHNFGLEKALGDWVLFVDADEEVSPLLREEIKQKISTEKIRNGFYLRRTDVFMNKKLTHGETAHTKFVRLAKKGRGVWHREVHEYWKVTEPLGQLHHSLIHHSHLSVASLISTLNFYTSIDAEHMVKTDNVKFQLVRVLVNPIGKFIQNYIWRRGFLDGFAGFVMAFMMSFNSLLVRVKIYDLEISSQR